MHVFTWVKGKLGDFYTPVMIIGKLIGIIILAILVVRLGSFLIRKIFEKQKTFKYKMNDKKLDTMSTLLVSIFRYTVYIVSLVIIFSDVFQFKSILAAAGIGGVAIGLGAQSLIKDVISGFFIIMEDQYVVGDVITIDNMSGTVEYMELRVTKIRNVNGDLYTIPNGEVKKVTNHTRGNKMAVVDVPISYEADVTSITEIVENSCKAVAEELSTIVVEEPKILGITELGKDNMVMRIIAKTLPNEQFELERRLRRLILEGLKERGIEFREKNKFIVYNDKS